MYKRKNNSVTKNSKAKSQTSSKKKKKISQSTYINLLTEIKNKIQQAQTRAFLSVTREMIVLYWNIGQIISYKQKQEGWGAKVIEMLSDDLRSEFPDSQSFSVRNLKHMLKFYRTYLDCAIVKQLVSQIPWGHNIVIMQKVESSEEREYYLRECIKNGWSRNVLIYQIESNLYERDNEAKKQTNFKKILPEELAAKTQAIFKDEYSLEFLGIKKEVHERELESKMLEQIRDVLLELGQGFTFVGNQYKVQVGEEEYFIDLLFFHRVLQNLVAVELKIDKFIPEYAGKMNFYLNILDKFVKLPHENPTLGIILCRNKNRTTVEFALQGIDKPMGVAQYYLTKKLPKEFDGKLPSAGQIEQKIKDIEKSSSKTTTKLEKGYQNILRELQKFGKVSPSNSKLQKSTGYSHSRLSRILNKLAKDGYIIKQRQGKFTFYSISPDYQSY